MRVGSDDLGGNNAVRGEKGSGELEGEESMMCQGSMSEGWSVVLDGLLFYVQSIREKVHM